MNKIGVVCIIPFLIAAIGAVKNPCKDVTFGECDIQKSRVLSNVTANCSIMQCGMLRYVQLYNLQLQQTN